MKKLSKQITIGVDPYSGSRIRKRIYATSVAGLKQAEKDAIREFAKQGISSKMLYKAYEDRWVAAYRSDVEPHTKATTMSILSHTRPIHGKKMSAVTKTDLQSIINDCKDHPYTCRSLASMFKHIWECAISDNVVSKNVAYGLKTPKPSKTIRRPLTKKELEGLTKADLDASERFMADVLLQFGLRPAEAFALDRNSFNRKTRTLTIDRDVAYDGNRPYIKGTKTGVTRVLPVPDSFWSKIPKINTLYFFVNDQGQLMTKSQTRYFQKHIIDKINVAMGGNKNIRLTSMTFYNFRHNKASLLYYLPGISLKAKAQYMGHSEKMFLETYSHMMEDKEDLEVLREAVV